MMNDFLYGVFPYLAFLVAVSVGLYRYFGNRFSFSSLSSQFLENEALFYGSVSWHYGIVLVLLGHLFGGLFPKASAFLIGGPARLFIAEWIGASLGLFALLGMIILVIRRLIHPQVLANTTVMDWILIAALSLQAGAGVSIALFFRWGSLWYLDTAVPWFWSLAGLNPRFAGLIPLPWIVQFHIINAFVIVALFPFTRLVHIFTVPFSYLWRSYQVCIWNRRTAPAAGIGVPGHPSEIERPGATALPQAELTRRGFLARATGALILFVGVVAGIPLVGEVVGPIYRQKKREWVKVTDIASLPVDQPVNPTFAMQVVQAYMRQTDLRQVWLIKHADNTVTVYSPICPHLGCHYHWNPQSQRFECPCHGSVYTLDGRVIGGPAPRPLDTLAGKVEGGILYVQWEEFQVGVAQKIPV
jgi:nitrate reductase gamma subunit